MCIGFKVSGGFVGGSLYQRIIFGDPFDCGLWELKTNFPNGARFQL
jgi:hypothetical protein